MESNATGPFQYAKEIASKISSHPGGITARELYRLHGDRFAEWNCDGNKAAALISQHLTKMQEDGLVVSEKMGNNPSAPRKWSWIDGARKPEDQPAERRPIGNVTAATASNTVVLIPENPFDALLIAIRKKAASLRPPIERREEKIEVLNRLCSIVSSDLARVLTEIVEDMKC